MKTPVFKRFRIAGTGYSLRGARTITASIFAIYACGSVPVLNGQVKECCNDHRYATRNKNVNGLAVENVVQ